MTMTDVPTVVEALEAEIRQAMAKLPKPETCRGWLTGRARQDGLDWLDCLLDEWNELTSEP